MGSSNSIPAEVLENAPQTLASQAEKADWGTVPEDFPADERDPSELVLQAWAFCKAKPSPEQMYRSDVDERKRRQSLQWRKRTSFIELDCGEDSFFVANSYKVIGVADGVGGWRQEGVDASLFSNSLMENAKHFAETHRKELDPEVILTQAYNKTVQDGKVKAGSSTACIATLRETVDGRHVLDVANLGDSGALVIRNREQIFRAHEKVHGFNAPFQLAVLPKHLIGRAFSDKPSDALREGTFVEEGDVVVLGTDGYFDNRFNSEIAADAGWVGRTKESVVSKIPLVGFWLSGYLDDDKVEYIDPYRVAQRLVGDAYKVSVKKDGNSPWASMLRQYGDDKAEGGKPDDITVVLARVGTREALTNNAVW